ncbi:MAG: protein kinase, partial [Fimbriimonadaceae bacterium]|nr:protein kinase [Fimbriimonadaceae bacterium]
MRQKAREFHRIRQLGSGSQGTVWEVEDPSDLRRYALKRLNPGQNLSAELLRCWKSLQQETPGGLLLPVDWSFPENEPPEILYPLVRTTSPRDLISAGGPPAAYSLLLQAAIGLSSIHSLGYIHSDLKPENILVESAGGIDPLTSVRVILGDLDLLATPSQTSGRKVSGTLGYLPPESLGAGVQGKAADVFALGMWLFWAITGAQPLVGSTSEESLRRAIEFRSLPTLGQFDPRFAGGAWDDLLARMVARDPSARIGSNGNLTPPIFAAAESLLDDTSSIPELLWNQGVLQSEESEVVQRAVEHCLESAMEAGGAICRLPRAATHTVATQQLRLSALALGTHCSVIPPETPAIDVLEQLRDAPEGVAVVGVASRDAKSRGELLRAVGASSRADTSKLVRLIVLDDGGDRDSHPEEDEGLTRAGMVEFRPRPATRSTFADWLSRLFSGVPIQDEIVEEVERSTECIPGPTVDYLSWAIQAKVLHLESGALGLRPYTLQPHANRAGDLRAGLISSPSLADALVDLLAGIPNGVPSSLVRHWESVISGFSRALRGLLESGRVRLNPDEDAVYAVRLPGECIGYQAQPAMVRECVSTGLEWFLAQPGGDSTGLRQLALRLRCAEVSASETSRATAAGEWLRKSSGPRPALAILHGIDNQKLFSMSAHRQVVVARARANSYWALGEFQAMKSMWSAAAEAGRGLPNRSLVSRVLLEKRISEGRLGPGFTAEAEEALTGGDAGGGIRERLAAEECVAMGNVGGFEAANQEWRALERIGANSFEAGALWAYALARGAEEKGDIGRATQLYSEAVERAVRSHVPFVIARVVSYAAGSFLKRGMVLDAAAVANALTLVPDHVYNTTDKYSTLSVLGGIAYEQGDLRKSLQMISELVSIAVLRESSALELSARKNLVSILCAMSRLGESYRQVSALSEAKVDQSQGFGLPPTLLRALVASEIGDIGGAEAELSTLRSEDSDKLTDFVAGHRSLLDAHCAFLSGDRVRCRESLFGAVHSLKACSSLDDTSLAYLRGYEWFGREVEDGWGFPALSGIREAAGRAGQARVATRAEWLELRLGVRGAGSGLGRLASLRNELRRSGEALLEL